QGLERVLNAVRSCKDAEVFLDGDENRWDKLVLCFSSGKMVLTSLVRHVPGDRFSTVVLSMHNFFRRVNTTGVDNKERLLESIANAQMLIGFVADPVFSENDSRLDCLWTISEKLDALIFNGEAMLNSKGERVMTEDGHYDVSSS